jgi:hypothetical protein
MQDMPGNGIAGHMPPIIPIPMQENMFPANIGMPAAAGPAAAAAVPGIPIPIGMYGMGSIGGQYMEAVGGITTVVPAAGVPIAGAALAAAAEAEAEPAVACCWLHAALLLLPGATTPPIGGTTMPGTLATVCTGIPHTIPRVATGALSQAAAAPAAAVSPCAADAAVTAVVVPVS